MGWGGGGVDVGVSHWVSLGLHAERGTMESVSLCIRHHQHADNSLCKNTMSFTMSHSFLKKESNCLKSEMNCLLVSTWSLKGKHWLSKVNIYGVWGLYFNRPGTAGPQLDSSHCLEPVCVLFSTQYCAPLEPWTQVTHKQASSVHFVLQILFKMSDCCSATVVNEASIRRAEGGCQKWLFHICHLHSQNFLPIALYVIH